MEASLLPGLTFDDRIIMSGHLKEKYPDRVPILVRLLPESLANAGIYNKHKLIKYKFLTPRDLNILDVLRSIAYQVHPALSGDDIVYIKHPILEFTDQIDYVYRKYRHSDGFLYLTCEIGSRKEQCLVM